MKAVCVMNKIRFKFTRGDEIKYLSHLDLIRLFDRTLRRCDLPIAYSIGFNPHPQMIFGLPLSVGVTSECEYADFEFSSDIEVNYFIEKISNQLPKGIEIIDAKQKKSKENIMASIVRVSYIINIFSEEIESTKELNEMIINFLKPEKIVAKKEKKNKVSYLDIKQMIHEIKVIEDKETAKNNFCLEVCLSAGSNENLKPELLIKTISENTSKKIEIKKIHRIKLFAVKKGEILNPMDDEILYD